MFIRARDMQNRLTQAPGVHEHGGNKTILDCDKLRTKTDRRIAPTNLLILGLIVALTLTGPLAAYDFAMETRETYDSMMKCGEFLEASFPEGVNALTNENGPWYVHWFSRWNVSASSIPLSIVEESDNTTQLVLDVIKLRRITVVIVFERLSYPLVEVYERLCDAGLLKLVRDYNEYHNWRTIIYEVA